MGITWRLNRQVEEHKKKKGVACGNPFNPSPNVLLSSLSFLHFME